MPPRYLTTGQVAQLLSVKPDTVLKWIRSGMLPARRTAGGHHRINQADVEHLTRMTRAPSPSKGPRIKFRKPTVQYCWDLYRNGGIRDTCRQCSVYLLRAQRCYQVARLASEGKIVKNACSDSCEECDFYNIVREQNTNVLLVTRNESVSARLKGDADLVGVNMRVADDAYSASLVINGFRPDFVVIDCEIGDDACEIGEHITRDPRVPNARLVVAGDCHKNPPECEQKMLARIERPSDLFEIIKHFETQITD